MQCALKQCGDDDVKQNPQSIFFGRISASSILYMFKVLYGKVKLGGKTQTDKTYDAGDRGESGMIACKGSPFGQGTTQRAHLDFQLFKR